MADLKLVSTDKTVSIDIQAGFTGVHGITVMSAGVSRPVSEQELIDMVAPCIRKALEPTSPAPPAPLDSIGT